MKRSENVDLLVGVALVLAGCGGQVSEAPSDSGVQDHALLPTKNPLSAGPRTAPSPTTDEA